MIYYDYYSLVLLLPLFILSAFIQMLLNLTYTKMSRVNNSRNTTGAEIAQMILRRAGVYDVAVECVSGKLTDHFDPSKNVIRLSSEVYNGTSISAIGVAAHETGHALQYAENYSPMRFRSAIVGITNFSSKILYLVVMLSFIAQIPVLCDIAVMCYLVIFAFQLITLPVEFNASKRAVVNIEETGYSDTDIRGVKKVLTCAAMTYVVAMLVSLGQLITYVLRTRRRD